MKLLAFQGTIYLKTGKKDKYAVKTSNKVFFTSKQVANEHWTMEYVNLHKFGQKTRIMYSVFFISTKQQTCQHVLELDFTIAIRDLC